MPSETNPAKRLVSIIEGALIAERNLQKRGDRAGQRHRNYLTAEVWSDAELAEGASVSNLYLSEAVARLGEVLVLVDSIERRLEDQDAESVSLLGLDATYRVVREMVGLEAGLLSSAWSRDQYSSTWKRAGIGTTVTRGPIVNQETLQSLKVCGQLLRARAVLNDAELHQVDSLRAEGAEVKQEASQDESLSPETRSFIVDSVNRVDEALVSARTEGPNGVKDVASDVLHKVLADPNLGQEVASSTAGKKATSWAAKVASWGFEAATKAVVKAAIDPWVQHTLGQLMPGS